MLSKLYVKRRSIEANVRVTPPMRTKRNLKQPEIKLGISRESLRQNIERDWHWIQNLILRDFGTMLQLGIRRHSVRELLVNGNIDSTPKDIAAELSSPFKSVHAFLNGT